MLKVHLCEIIDIVPTVDAERATIQLLVVATIKEFLGYEESGEFEAYLKSEESAQQAEPPSERTPLPSFRERQVEGSAVVADGQTLVLHGGSIVVEKFSKTKSPSWVTSLWPDVSIAKNAKNNPRSNLPSSSRRN